MVYTLFRYLYNIEADGKIYVRVCIIETGAIFIPRLPLGVYRLIGRAEVVACARFNLYKRNRPVLFRNYVHLAERTPEIALGYFIALFL